MTSRAKEALLDVPPTDNMLELANNPFCADILILIDKISFACSDQNYSGHLSHGRKQVLGTPQLLPKRMEKAKSLNWERISGGLWSPVCSK